MVFELFFYCVTVQTKNRPFYFTVVCLVAWPLNESEAEFGPVLIETSLLFFCKFLLISMGTAIRTGTIINKYTVKFIVLIPNQHVNS